MTFVPLQKILPKTLSRLGLSKQAKASLICEKFRKIIAEDFSPKIFMNIWPKHYRDGVLTLGVSHPLLAQELMERKHQLLKKMNQSLLAEWPALRKKPVENIKTVVSDVPERYIDSSS